MWTVDHWMYWYYGSGNDRWQFHNLSLKQLSKMLNSYFWYPVSLFFLENSCFVFRMLTAYPTLVELITLVTLFAMVQNERSTPASAFSSFIYSNQDWWCFCRNILIWFGRWNYPACSKKSRRQLNSVDKILLRPEYNPI